MKATKVIEEYKKGKRNFRGLNLRGANFKGQDLSGADFSYCQIQSANFSEANLTNTKFIGVKAGLQKRWMIILLFVIFVLICVSSLFSAFFGFIIDLTFKSNIEDKVIAWTGLIILMISCVIGFRKNLERGFISVAIVVAISAAVLGMAAFVGTFIEAIAEVSNLIGAGAVAGAFVGGFLVIFILIIATVFLGTLIIAGIVPGVVAGTFAGTFAVVGAVSGTSAGNLAGTFAGAFAIALTLFACFMGYFTLKDETRDPWLRRIAIYFAAIRGTSFYNSTLTDADFTAATLKNTNFNKAILIRTCFKDTIKLNLARPGNTLLAKPNVRDLLINPSSGEGEDFTEADLRGANLREANLQRANLKQADISNATFQYANLLEANLTEVNAVNTDFTHTYLTGVCLENWNIDNTTKLDDVDCQYVYLLNNQKELRPSSGQFKPGEFTKLFKQVFDTVDFIFEKGIDWKAFIETIKTVQVQNEDTPLEVSSIENKGDGVFVVKVKVPPDANKEKIHQEFEENYKLKLESVEADYKRLLAEKDIDIKNKDEIIKVHHQHNANMMEIIKTQANRPIIVEAKAMSNSSDSSQNVNIRDINNSGVFNLGKVIEDVNKIINEIPENSNNSNTELNGLLKELITAINSEDSLDKDDKAEAVNQVKKIAKACQEPENESLQNKAKQAVNFLEIIAKGVEPAGKLAKAFQNVLPFIISRLG